MRVLLADDHRIFREGLRSLLDAEPDLEVVGDVADGAGAITAAAEHDPDVVLMDVSMPGLNGIDATRAIVAGSPPVRVLCLSMHIDRGMVSAALEAGASGYLLKGCASTELVGALHDVVAGRVYLSPAVTRGRVSDYLSQLAAERGDEPVLTPREREVLQSIAEGRGTKEIGVRLGISAKTVATHREHIMAKLDLYSVAGLTRHAINQGMTSSDRMSPK